MNVAYGQIFQVVSGKVVLPVCRASLLVLLGPEAYITSQPNLYKMYG